MVLRLVKPDKKYLPSVYKAVEEYKSDLSKFEIGAVKKMIGAIKNNFSDYFKDTKNNSLGINLEPNFVPDTVFWLVDDEKYIGTFDLRHSLTPALEQSGGHIAYQIRPSERCKGYACKGLELCLEKAHDIGLKRVLITCKEENAASYAVMRKTMRKVGGEEIEPFAQNGVVNKRIRLYTQKL